MKIRNGFVSNSSSSSFVIKNTSNYNKYWSDFVDMLFELEHNPKKLSNGKSPGKFKGNFTKKQLLECEYKDMIFSAYGGLVLLYSGDEAYENPTSVIRGLLLWHSGIECHDFKWKEVDNDQREDW